MIKRRPYNLAAALGLVPLIRLHLLTFGAGLLAIAASLQWEPEEWMSPIYGIAFQWLRPSQWAALLAFIGAGKLVACVAYPAGVPLALVAGNLLFVVWGVSFTFAYAERGFGPTSPLLAMLAAFAVGEHLAVAYLLQREKTLDEPDADESDTT